MTDAESNVRVRGGWEDEGGEVDEKWKIISKNKRAQTGSGRGRKSQSEACRRDLKLRGAFSFKESARSPGQVLANRTAPSEIQYTYKVPLTRTSHTRRSLPCKKK